MFGGAPINITEHRAVLHVALRAPRDTSIAIEGRNVIPPSVSAAEIHPAMTRTLSGVLGVRAVVRLDQLSKRAPSSAFART
jgi:hypothetical protein